MQSHRPWFQQFTTVCSLCLLSLFLPNMYPTPVHSRPQREVAPVAYVAQAAQAAHASHTAQPPAPNPSSFYRGSQPATIAPPDLSISKHHTYVMSPPASGQQPQQAAGLLRYTLSVSNAASAGPITAISPIIVIDEIPAGLANVRLLAAPDWNIALSSPTSPLTLTATYTGSAPIQPGQTLPEIVYSGNLTPQGMPTLLNTARVETPGDVNVENNQAADRVYMPYAQRGREVDGR